MKIAILGAGAIGSLYAAKFAQNPENEVLCIVKSQKHADKINREGIFVSDSSGKLLFSARPSAVTDTGALPPAELVLVAVKSYMTASAAREHASIFGPETVVLTLQNGYGNHNDLLPYTAIERLLIGTTAMGVNIPPEGSIILAGQGKSILGSLAPDSQIGKDALRRAYDLLVSSGFETEITQDAEDAVLQKLLINAGINALCSLNNCANHFIADDAAMRQQSEALVREAVSVINTALHRKYQPDTVWQLVCSVAEKTGNNICSMLQDVRSGRPTEIDKINGAVVKIAAKANLTAPLNQKITEAIHTLTL